jgi:hypothetical protein
MTTERMTRLRALEPSIRQIARLLQLAVNLLMDPVSGHAMRLVWVLPVEMVSPIWKRHLHSPVRSTEG